MASEQAVLRRLSNQENESPCAHQKPKGQSLEKLLVAQIALTREAEAEQERLEHGLLLKEQQMCELQASLKNANQFNKQLSKKIRSETDTFEQELIKWQQAEKTWKQRLRASDHQILELEETLRYKEEIISSLDGQLERALAELSEKNKELELSTQNVNMTFSDSEDGGDQLLDDSSESEVFNSDADESFNFLDGVEEDHEEEEDLDHREVPRSSLTSELNSQLNEKDKTIQKLQFEIRSLKNEKSQLYTYVNKLLRNKPHPGQNDVLKDKLVKRKILRSASSTYQPHTRNKPITSGLIGKRIMSNIVTFKSYTYKRPALEVHNNSDDEEEEEEAIELERKLLQLSKMKPFAWKTVNSMSPLQSILYTVKHTGKDIDLDVD